MYDFLMRIDFNKKCVLLLLYYETHCAHAFILFAFFSYCAWHSFPTVHDLTVLPTALNPTLGSHGVNPVVGMFRLDLIQLSNCGGVLLNLPSG